VSLPVEQRSVLEKAVGFTDCHITIAAPRWSASMQRIAFPMYGPLGERTGWVLRSFDNYVRPKALTFLQPNAQRLAYYYEHPDSDTVLLVEDMPSAVRAAPYINSIALLGTTLSDDAAFEIAQTFRHVIVALDADAAAQGIALQRRLRLLFSQTDVLLLPCDLKDMQEEELLHLLGGFTR
jgi:DNA primase